MKKRIILAIAIAAIPLTRSILLYTSAQDDAQFLAQPALSTVSVSILKADGTKLIDGPDTIQKNYALFKANMQQKYGKTVNNKLAAQYLENETRKYLASKGITNTVQYKTSHMQTRDGKVFLHCVATVNQ